MTHYLTAALIATLVAAGVLGPGLSTACIWFTQPHKEN